MHFKSHKLISSNVKRHTKSKRGRKKCFHVVQQYFHQCTIYRSAPVYVQQKQSTSPAAVLAVLRSVLGRVGIMTREEQGVMPAEKSILQEIRCKPSSCCRETVFVWRCVSVILPVKCNSKVLSRRVNWNKLHFQTRSAFKYTCVFGKEESEDDVVLTVSRYVVKLSLHALLFWLETRMPACSSAVWVQTGQQHNT